MNLRNLLGAVAVGAFSAPAARSAVAAADAGPRPPGSRRVGRADAAELWEAAADARRWDSRYGGADQRTSAAVGCLSDHAMPMLRGGTYSDAVGRELYAAAAELSRAVGWAAVDAGHHGRARRHLSTSLRLTYLSGDVQAAAYVLSTMSLQAFLTGHPHEAAGMAEAAYERARTTAAPRVLAFARLAQARGHARAGEARAASAALAHAENLLDRVRPATDPLWLAYLTHARLASDAIEIYRDLHNPAAALRWATDARAMPQGRFTRAVGLRCAVEATAHLQGGDLDRGLATGRRALDILALVRSARARSYVGAIVTALEPWRTEPQVLDFVHRARCTPGPGTSV